MVHVGQPHRPRIQTVPRGPGESLQQVTVLPRRLAGEVVPVRSGARSTTWDNLVRRPADRLTSKEDALQGPMTSGRPGSPEDLLRALRAQGLRDRRVIAAFRAIPRRRFVPPAAAGLAYMDAPIPIPMGR